MDSTEFLIQLPAALAALATLAVLAAAVFGRATHADRENDIDIGGHSPPEAARELAAHIEDLLPQTQCGQCGHPGCQPYARAIAAGEPFNKCPPGGHTTICLLYTSPSPRD